MLSRCTARLGATGAGGDLFGCTCNTQRLFALFARPLVFVAAAGCTSTASGKLTTTYSIHSFRLQATLFKQGTSVAPAGVMLMGTKL